jgi:biotin carboxyl carrier protein
MHYDINVSGKAYRLDLEQDPAPDQQSRWLCRLDGREITVDALQIDANTLSLVIGGRTLEIRRENAGETQRLFIRGRQYDVAVRDSRSLRSRNRAGASDAGPLRLTASMPGKVVRVLAKEGESLQAGMGIAVVEAMKMQNEIRSPKNGTLVKMLAREGMNVNAGDVLAVLE